MKPANNGPIYALGFYPKLAEVFRGHGYALAIHGSVGADFDLIAVPWIDGASEPEVVINAVMAIAAVKRYAESGPITKPHGRIAYKLYLSFGDCALDISFTPRADPANVPTRDPDLQVAAEELLNAANRLAALDPATGRPYFESRIDKDHVAFNRWIVFADTLSRLKHLLAARTKGEK